MGDITEIWRDNVPVDPPELQLKKAIIESGLEAPKEIIFDGKIHRFNSGTKGKKNDKSGWYIAFGDGVCAGKFGDWRWDVEHKWVQDIGRRLTPSEEIEFSRKMEASKKARESASGAPR